MTNELITSISPIYRCPTCRGEYETEIEALTCFNSDAKPEFKVGDIVTFGDRFGWFEGDKNWITNGGLPTGDFNGIPTYSFFYVVTKVTTDRKHRAVYHVATNAMSGAKGYKGGYTVVPGHDAPELAENPPQIVIETSKELLGMEFKDLL